MLSYHKEYDDRDARVKRVVDLHPKLLLVLDEWVRLRNIGRKGVRGVTNYNRSDAVARCLFFGLDEVRKDVREMIAAESALKEAEKRVKAEATA